MLCATVLLPPGAVCLSMLRCQAVLLCGPLCLQALIVPVCPYASLSLVHTLGDDPHKGQSIYLSPELNLVSDATGLVNLQL